MKNKKVDITIIGAGLTGLALAYFLKNTGHSILILEARNRIGGRIETLQRPNLAPLEMGATWLGEKHQALTTLLEELSLPTFEQKLGRTAIYEPISTSPPQLVKLPPNDAPSYRIVGGTSQLIQALAEKIQDVATLQLNQQVKRIKETGSRMLVETDSQVIESKVVVSTLPPYLLANTVTIESGLPSEVINTMQRTHTWMGDSIKVGLFFKNPFWRSKKLSGTLFSNVGPIPEMYDHSNVEDTQFALVGFLNGNYFSLAKEERLALMLHQLRKYFGQKVDDYIDYQERVWRKELFTFTPYATHLLPHQNNGHVFYRQPYLSSKFFIAGSETADQFPGYMDGAVRSARYVAKAIAI